MRNRWYFLWFVVQALGQISVQVLGQISHRCAGNIVIPAAPNLLAWQKQGHAIWCIFPAQLHLIEERVLHFTKCSKLICVGWRSPGRSTWVCLCSARSSTLSVQRGRQVPIDYDFPKRNLFDITFQELVISADVQIKSNLLPKTLDQNYNFLVCKITIDVFEAWTSRSWCRMAYRWKTTFNN